MLADRVIRSRDPRRPRKTLAGYEVTVRPGATFTSTTEVFGKHTLTVGKVKVSIKNYELEVNGHSYGELQPGDTISIQDSQVRVSGKVRDAR